MSTPERTEGAALEAGLLRNVQEEKNSLLQDYETQDETTSTQAKATEPAETRKRTNGWKIVTLLVVGLLVGSALTKTTVMHCRRPAPRVVAVVLEKQPATSEMPDKFWEENFQAELEKPVTLYKRQAGELSLNLVIAEAVVDIFPKVPLARVSNKEQTEVPLAVTRTRLRFL